MSKLFGGTDPFDDPFFTSPFDYLFGGESPFSSLFFAQPCGIKTGADKQITIVEVNSDGHGDYDAQQHFMPGKELAIKNTNDKAGGTRTLSFQRVAYGGLDGMYYSSAVARRTGGNGVVVVEMKEEDKTIGETIHTISRGISDKGHSLTTKHNSDGRVDSMQTLHNLNEDELSRFEDAWKDNAEKYLPGWNSNLIDYAGSSGSGWEGLPTWGGWSWALPGTEDLGNPGATTSVSERMHGGGRAKKVVPVNIE